MNLKIVIFKNMNPLLKDLIFIATCIILLCILVPQKRKENEAFIKDKSRTNFAIGTIISYSGRDGGFVGGIIRSTPHGSLLHFSYFVNNKEYEQHDENVPEVGQKEGDKFLVVFYIDTPQKSMMLFKYPVKDSLDYQRYLKEFKTKRPELY